MLTSSHLVQLARLGHQHSFRKDALILNEGELGDTFYILLEGQVRALGRSLTGKEITYGLIETGEYFGEMALDGGARSASIQAQTNCNCVLVPNAQVLAFAREHPDFASHLLQTVIHRARLATEAARSMALSDVYERLRKLLQQTFDAQQGVCTQTHSALAAQIGASRDMVSKLIKDLERGGYIEALQRTQFRQIKKIPMRW
jgi:CRP/FNR family transcriptional regulator, cyclic AMP receptor protein